MTTHKFNYFSSCLSTDDVRNTYRSLAKKYHPDLGGDLEIMKDINTQYAFYSNKFYRTEKPGQPESSYESMIDLDEVIRLIILDIINLPGLDIEICGLWVWVSGNTRENKEHLKTLGFKWARIKKKWYFAGVPARSRGNSSMDDIRDRYGSRVYKSKTKPSIS